MALNPGTNRQSPDHSIMDQYNKQTYLGNSYGTTTGLVSLSGTSEVAFLYIANSVVPGPAGLGVSIFQNLRKLLVNDVTGATGAVFRIYTNVTSVSGGTTVTPGNLRTASPNVSISTIKLSPTWSVTGTAIATFSVGWENQNESSSMLIIDPGKNMMITAQPTASTQCCANITWYEI